MTPDAIRRDRPIARLAAAAVCAGGLAIPSAAHAETLVTAFEARGAHPALAWLPEGVALLVAEAIEAEGERTHSRVARERIFDALGVPPGAPLSRTTLVQVAELVGADALVTGVVEVDGDELIVRARRVAPDDERRATDVVERGRLDEVFTVAAQVGARLAPAGGGTDRIDREQGDAGGDALPELSLAAFERYVKGLVARTPEARVEHLEGALELSPDYDPARLELSSALAAAGDWEAALAVVREVSEDGPLATEARLRAVRALVELGRLDEAFDSLSRMRGRDPSASVLSLLGIVQLRRGSPPRTGRGSYYLHQAAERSGDPDSLFNLGYAYLREGDPSGAAYWLHETLQHRPDDAEARYVLGTALIAAGRAEEGANQQALARLVDPDVGRHPDTRTGDVEVAPDLERWPADESSAPERSLDPALREASARLGARLVRHHLAQADRLALTGLHAAALAEATAALRLAPETVSILDRLARLHDALDRREDARLARRLAAWLGAQPR